ncbi:MAG: hypothetical protein J7M19_02705 [Planctomycetes bacterium]|nr:hypothetical protein [Planctomycetota bacterium]
MNNADGTTLQKIGVGVSTLVLGAVLLGWVGTVGDVRANTSAIGAGSQRIDNCELAVRKQSDDLAEIKAEVRATRVILERVERHLEEKRR